MIDHNFILTIYIVFGIVAFLYELMQGSGWKLSLFIGIFYPVTMILGLFYGLVTEIIRFFKREKHDL